MSANIAHATAAAAPRSPYGSMRAPLAAASYGTSNGTYETYGASYAPPVVAPMTKMAGPSRRSLATAAPAIATAASPTYATTVPPPPTSVPTTSAARPTSMPIYPSSDYGYAPAAPVVETASVKPAALPPAPIVPAKLVASFCRSPATTETQSEISYSGDWQRQATETQHGIRTQADAAVSPGKAIQKLREGNQRYVHGKPQISAFAGSKRASLADHGQLPFATILGCADSRCSVEILFDTMPGDLFVLRNAGNTCTHAEGSMIGSMEYSIGHLRTNLVLVLGHTKCGAIVGACGVAKKKKQANAKTTQPSSELDRLLEGFCPVAMQAAANLAQRFGPDAVISDAQVAEEAIKVNVFHTIEKMLAFSKSLREKVRKEEVEVQGAIYDIVTGEVEFLGRTPRQFLVLDMEKKTNEDCAFGQEAQGA